MADYVELFVDQGSNFSSNIVISSSTTNAFMNITNSVITGKYKRSFYSSNVSGTFICTKLDSANGIVSISLPSETTINLTGRYVYTVKMVTSTTTTIVVDGSLFINPQT